MAVCRAGTCDFTCMAGFSDCDRNPANGCETDLSTDANNCMMCGNRCTAPVGRVPLCRMSACTTGIGVCPDGRGDCNAMDGDAPHGDCNACHTQMGTTTVAGGDPAPGRITVPL